MAWPKHVEQWREYASWESRDIPTDLVLSIISNESGGRAGIKSYRSVKAAQVPNDAGDIVTANHALGLMQCIPSHINSWNQNRPTRITIEDMTGNDERAVRLQIRLGSSVFASCVNHLHKYDPVQFPGDSPGKATPEQLRLALLCYAAGPGRHGGTKGLIPRLDKLREAGKPLTLDELTETFPRWGYSETAGRWINRPLDAANTVWNQYQKNIQTKDPRTPRGSGPELPPKKKRWFSTLGSFPRWSWPRFCSFKRNGSRACLNRRSPRWPKLKRKPEQLPEQLLNGELPNEQLPSGELPNEQLPEQLPELQKRRSQPCQRKQRLLQLPHRIPK